MNMISDMNSLLRKKTHLVSASYTNPEKLNFLTHMVLEIKHNDPIEVNESCMYPRCKVFKNNLLGFNPLLLNQAKSGLSQWFLNLLSNQAKHTSLACLAWFDRRFKNHWLLTRVLGTHFNQKDRTKTTMRTSKRLV